ncbi:MAG: 2'-5' RNA ligase family protein [Chloroflexi bacterium]|nr:2'-5' RNA ligase family protein [Chloroflexota bacterium]
MGYVGYAVELYFDPALSAKIRRLWETIHTTCGGAAVGVEPHISLAVVDTPQPDQLQQLTKIFAQQHAPLPIALDAIGTFPSAEGVVYLAPVVTLALLELHRDFHQQLADNALIAYPYYRPGQWIPHCTVGIQLPAEKIADALACCRASAIFERGHLMAISLIELPAVRELAQYVLEAQSA